MTKEIGHHIQIPASELRLTFARSSGAGGQNVNKTSTKVTVHWPIWKSQVLSWDEKIRLGAKLGSKINSDGELVVVSEEERSQAQNRVKAEARLQALVTKILRVPKKRYVTRPTKASKIRRIEIKKQRSEIKKERRLVED